MLYTHMISYRDIYIYDYMYTYYIYIYSILYIVVRPTPHPRAARKHQDVCRPADMCDSQPKTCGFHQKTNPIYILHSQTYDICTYIYICICVCIYIYVCVCIYICINIGCILYTTYMYITKHFMGLCAGIYWGIYIYIIVSYQYVMWNCQKREICIWLMMGWNGTAGCRQSHTYLGLKVPYLVMKG